MTDIEEAISYIESTEKHLRHLGESWYADYLSDAIELLKEQEDLGTELTNAVELIHKKNERIEKLLKEQEAMMQCIKEKCRICPHCANCDVDENGLLKEQEAVEPYMDFDGHDVWRCGKCGATIFHIYHNASDEDAKNYAKFCRHCGRSVKWE